MVAPIPGLALPLRIPQLVVCGQFASSHKPIMGRTIMVSSRTSVSLVKILPHASLPNMVPKNPKKEVNRASPMATTAANRALLGLPAPSSLPTRVDAAALSAVGNVYIREVVCIIIADVAKATRGSDKYPARIVMNSYHHHSKQTAMQLGIANRSRTLHSFRSMRAAEEGGGDGGGDNGVCIDSTEASFVRV